MNHQTNQTDNMNKIPEGTTPPSTHSVSTNDRQRQYDSQLSTDRTKLATPAHRPASQSQVTSPRKGRSLRTATTTTSKVGKSDRWLTRTIPRSAQQPGQRHLHLIYKPAKEKSAFSRSGTLAQITTVPTSRRMQHTCMPQCREHGGECGVLVPWACCKEDLPDLMPWSTSTSTCPTDRPTKSTVHAADDVTASLFAQQACQVVAR
jgi:hypothetical protein